MRDALFRLTNDLAFACTRTGDLIETSSSWLDLLGYESSEIRSQNIFDFLTIDGAFAFQLLLDVAWSSDASKHPLTSEANFLDNDGRSRVFSLKFERVGDSLVAFGRPVATERSNTLSAGEQARWQLALEGAPAGLWDWNVVTDDVYFSSSFAKLFGYGPGELVSSFSTLAMLLHPEDIKARMRTIQDYLDGNEEFYSAESRMRTKSGEYRWTLSRGSAVRDAGGRVVRMVGWVLDIHDQKLAEQGLKESKAKVSAILNALPDTVSVLGRDLVYRDFYANNKSILPNPHIERIGRSLYEVLPGSQVAKVAAAVERVFEDGVLRNVDLEFECPNSTHGSLYVEARIARKSLDEVVVVVRDVTEQTIAAQALREGEARLQMIAKNVPGVLYQYRKEPTGEVSFPYVSPKIFELIEGTPSSLDTQGSGLMDLVHPEDRESLAQATDEATLRLIPFDWEGRLLTLNGGLKTIRCTSIPRLDSDGHIVFDGIILDVTAERRLQQDQRMLRTLVETSTDLVAIFKPDSTCPIYANPALREFAGLSTGDIGTFDISSIHPAWAHRRNVETGVPAALRDGVWIGESAILDRDGNEIPVSQMLTLIRREDGTLEYFGTIIRDISELKRAEKLLLNQQAQIAASSKLAALGEMAGGIAHEINNPLAIIHAYASRLREIVEEGDLDFAYVARAAAKIESTVMRISRIITGLRVISRDGEKDEFETTSVSTIIEDTLSVCSEKLNHKNIDLRVMVSPPDLAFDCKPVQVSQTLLNLVINSQHAIEDLDDRWISISARDLGEEIEIAVMDSGRGIPDDVREKMFQPFFTTKEIGKGTGLGLSISKSIMNGHGGTMFLDMSSPYTCFVLVFPKHHARSSTDRSAA